MFLHHRDDALQLYVRAYPRDYSPRNTLGNALFNSGQLEAALEQNLEGHRLAPKVSVFYLVLVRDYLALNRFDEAKALAQEGNAQIPDQTELHRLLLRAAEAQDDHDAAQKQIEWFAGKPEEYVGLVSQADDLNQRGQRRKAVEMRRAAASLARSRNLTAIAARLSSPDSGFDALAGGCALVRERGASAAPLCVDESAALKAAEARAKDDPERFGLNRIDLPRMRAGAELIRNQPERAIELLTVSAPYAATHPEISFFRGLAYLQARKPPEAAAEFQKILDHRGWNWDGPFYTLSLLGLGEAAALSGDAGKAKKTYQDFFAFWKDADPGHPILAQARKEYAALR